MGGLLQESLNADQASMGGLEAAANASADQYVLGQRQRAGEMRTDVGLMDSMSKGAQAHQQPAAPPKTPTPAPAPQPAAPGQGGGPAGPGADANQSAPSSTASGVWDTVGRFAGTLGNQLIGGLMHLF